MWAKLLLMKDCTMWLYSNSNLINHVFAENEVDEIWITFQILK
jgi:hypothetical protein